ncbi:MAG TPA: TetR/AcrR family transcriptional regulator [Actinomycetes bacterium]
MSPRKTLPEARRRQILEAAAQVIGERGLCDTRIVDVAKRAGASPGLVIYYFGSKDRVLAEALAYADEAFFADAANKLSTLPSARDQLVELVASSCPLGSAPDAVDSWVLWLELWARARRDAEVAEHRARLDQQWRKMLADTVRAGQKAGEFGTLDPDGFAIRLAALIDGLAIAVVLGDPEVDAERMFDLCMETCARELGFEWTEADRAKALAAHAVG